jgi:hypothetical protein
MSYFAQFPNMLYDYTKPGSQSTNLIIVKDIIRRVKLNSSVASSIFAYDEYDIQEGERPDILAHQFYNSSKLAWVILLTNEIHDLYEDWPRTGRELSNMINKKYGGSGPYALKGTDTSVGHSYSGKNGYYYPLFLNAKDANEYDRLQGYAGGSHIHNFSEFPSTTFYMPNGVNRGHASFSFDNGLYRLWTPNSGPDGVHHYERPQLSGDTTKHVRTTETTYVTYPSPGTTQTLSSLIITNRQYEEAENEKKRRIKILRANLVQEFVNEFKLIIKD